MKTAVKSPESAVYRRGLGIFLAETPLTEAPKHLFRPLFPRNPHFPASGPSQWLFQGPPAESKFLAVREMGFQVTVVAVMEGETVPLVSATRTLISG
jgi:hypothetical protein